MLTMILSPFLALAGIVPQVSLDFGPWFFLRYFPRKERSEGERLEKIYGDDFRLYRSEVPALMPALRPWHPAAGSLRFADPSLRWSGRRYSDNNELGTLLAQASGIGILTVRMISSF